uniref:Gypsy retrotransposon integrase-like protein 1 n=1 Tax=Nothobranchius furzeri TaxID=105023 RepID=A0A8C6KCM5_NOTFU
MDSSGVPAPRTDWDSANLPDAWRRFVQHVKLMFSGPLSSKPEETQCSYLLLWVGERGRDIYNTWQLSEEEAQKLTTYLDRFEQCLMPKTNTIFARYKFNERLQGEGESFEHFVTELKLLVKQCGYENSDEMIRDMIVFATRLQVDASKYGLGAVLMQDGHPVAYASKTLTPTEINYAQIEKELFAVLFGCKRFHTYIYGRRVLVESNHKPLEHILKKPISVAPARLQRMLLQLQRYDIKIVHRPGKDIPVADTLSRKPLLDQDSTLSEGMEDQIHSVINSLPVSDKKLSEIQAATRCDPQLTLLRQTVHDGWPEDRKKCPKTLLYFWNFRDEISHFHRIIFNGDKITALRNNMLERIHTGHVGIERSKQRARAALFWTGMGRDINATVENCFICQERCAANPKEPLIPHQIPERPWQVVASDRFTWRGRDYLVVVDYYSRYFEVERLFSTTAGSVIKKLKAIFARHGIPEKLVSDNGPQYSCREFKDFAVTWDFVHTTSSPLYPQSNGLAERTVQSAKSVLDKAHAQGVDPYLSLLEQRNTQSRRLQITSAAPHESTSALSDSHHWTPAVASHHKPDGRAKNTDGKARASEAPLPRLQQGDHIRFQHKSGSWKPAVIIRPAETARSFLIRTGEGQTIRRNRRHLRGAKAAPAPPAPTSDLVTQLDSAAPQQAEPLSPSRDTTTPTRDTSSTLTARSGRVVKSRVILDL